MDAEIDALHLSEENIMTLFVNKIQKDHEITLTIETAYQTFIWCLSHDITFIVHALKTASKDFDSIYGSHIIDATWVDCFKQTLALRFKDREVFLEGYLARKKTK